MMSYYPPAQEPEEAPPISKHSALVKHVPFLKDCPEDL